ncbi:MAG: His/Gly/Thr/Pro-type tRNA ligase C-terminal domain-containing protein, partial [Candidatus Taylorbacteria bacterium]|nr:His/Gly/Thr/Pro-type tRNA ligase C-terminal domain-containing protein [Candidatus Taylorbacteria bacterium]
LDLNVIPVEALSGIMGGAESHEFMLPAKIGEDKIAFCEKCNYAANLEATKTKNCPRCKTLLQQERAIELGHTFKLGVKYSEPFNIYFEDEKGAKKLTVMGSYGIGLDRLMASIVEVHNDEKGIIWPMKVAPFKVHLSEIAGREGSEVKNSAEKIYQDLLKQGIEVLYDDRDDKTPGEKFADADLIGCPIRLVVSNKTIAQDSVELKHRNQKDFKLIKLTELLESIK